MMFFEEAREQLQALEAGLMDLEARREDREHLDRTFRAAHTLKGAAGMVGLRPIAEFTHKVEAVLDDIRAGRMAVTPGAITILLRAKDHLVLALEEAVEGRTVGSPADLDEALVGLKEGRTEAGPTHQPKPESEPAAATVDTGTLPASAPDPVVEAPALAGQPGGPARPYPVEFRPSP